MPIPVPLIPLICETVYYCSRPVASLDPVAVPGTWSEQEARKTLWALSLINKTWHEEAGKFLWRRVNFRLAGGFLRVVDVVGGGEGDDDSSASDSDASVGGAGRSGVLGEKKRRKSSRFKIRPEPILPDRPPPRKSSLRISHVPASDTEDDEMAPPNPTVASRVTPITSPVLSTGHFTPPVVPSGPSTPAISPQPSPPPIFTSAAAVDAFFAQPTVPEDIITPPGSRTQSPARPGLVHTTGHAHQIRPRSLSPVRDRFREFKPFRDPSCWEEEERRREEQRSRSREEEEKARGRSPINRITGRSYTPVTIRDPSPARVRLAELREGEEDDEDMWFDPLSPATETPYPAKHINYISFSSFRTAGLRRSLAQGTEERFCTPERLLRLVNACRALRGFGASEYMDSALTLPVLESLLLRAPPNKPMPLKRSQSLHTRPVSAASRSLSPPHHVVPGRPLCALDLTGCVSNTFISALDEFVRRHLSGRARDSVDEADEEYYVEDEDEDERGRIGAPPPEYPATWHHPPLPSPTRTNPHTGKFTSLTRLNLSNLINVFSPTLTAFVLAFPNLTHLDLSNTRAAPALIHALARSQTVRLESLALARCRKLDGDCLLRLLVDGRAARTIRELNLYGDNAVPCPFNADELEIVLTRAPCFVAGEMRYLDLASAPLSASILAQLAPQPHLRSLGLANIPALPLKAVADFVMHRARNTEVVDLNLSTPELAVTPGNSSTARTAVLALQTTLIKPLTTPPFYFSLTNPKPASPPPTALRVVELGAEMLDALQGGAGSWRVVRSRGRRGWYINSAVRPCAVEEGQLQRDLARDNPWRREIDALSAARGNVASMVGWHSRKMEVLTGQGLLGREEGLYAVVAFSFGL